MANWTKKAQQAAAPILEPGERVDAGANVTAGQFAVTDGGFTGGLVAGGVVGAAAGTVYDRALEGKRAAEEAKRPKEAFDELPHRAVDFPENSALAAVTNRRLVLFGLSAMSKPRDVFFEVPLSEVTDVHERDVDQKLLLGAPGSREIIIVFDDQTRLSLYGLSGGLNRKWIEGFTTALHRATAAA